MKRYYPTERRVCARPLLDEIRNTHQLDQPTVEELGHRLGVSAQTIYRYRKHGVPEWTADRLAIHVGTHSSLLWPHLYGDDMNTIIIDDIDDTELCTVECQCEPCQSGRLADILEDRVLLEPAV